MMNKIDKYLNPKSKVSNHESSAIDREHCQIYQAQLRGKDAAQIWTRGQQTAPRQTPSIGAKTQGMVFGDLDPYFYLNTLF